MAKKTHKKFNKKKIVCFFYLLYIYIMFFLSGESGINRITIDTLRIQGSVSSGNAGESGGKKWGKTMFYNYLHIFLKIY